jgi:hypothetical protein
MRSWGKLRVAAVALLLCGPVASNIAAAADADALKGEVDAFIKRIDDASDGIVRWNGADSIDVKQNGDEAVVVIVNARLSLRDKRPDAGPPASMVLDRIELRRHPAPSGGGMTELLVSLPATTTIATGDGDEITLALKDAHATVLLEGDAERQRAATLDVAGGRLDEKTHSVQMTFASLAAHVKTDRNQDGSWRAPADFVLNDVGFQIPEAPLAGTIARIAYTGETAGPDLAAADALRDKAAALRENFRDDPQKRVQETLAMLPAMLQLAIGAKGDFTVEHVTAKRPDGETLVTLGKAWMSGSLSGLDGDKAAYRITLGHDGLSVAPSLLPETQVPRSADLDFGFEDIAVPTLRNMAELAGKAAADGSPDAWKRAVPTLIATAVSLQPVFHVYDAMVNFKDVSVDGSGSARRAPPPPLGYTAGGDVTIRGFDASREIVTNNLAQGYLALLKFLGQRATTPDGSEVTQFHLISAPGKPIAVNGNDISDWLQGSGSTEQTPRPLRLADPPEHGDDVRAVQKVVMTDVRTDGNYDVATALAVMRFQQSHGLNVNGIVDAATRDKLGIAPPAAPKFAPKN